MTPFCVSIVTETNRARPKLPVQNKLSTTSYTEYDSAV